MSDSTPMIEALELLSDRVYVYGNFPLLVVKLMFEVVSEA